jgi:hypothetical protein
MELRRNTYVQIPMVFKCGIRYGKRTLVGEHKGQLAFRGGTILIGGFMNRINHGIKMSIFGTLCMLAVTATAPAVAKGYSGGPDTGKGSDQQIRRRLTQVEETQKSLRDEMAAEVQKLRAEMASIKEQSAMKASFTTTK